MNLNNTVKAFEKAKDMAVKSQPYSEDQWTEGFWRGYEEAITFAINSLNEKINKKKSKKG
jgi:hypothetical protein